MALGLKIQSPVVLPLWKVNGSFLRAGKSEGRGQQPPSLRVGGVSLPRPWEPSGQSAPAPDLGLAAPLGSVGAQPSHLPLTGVRTRSLRALALLPQPRPPWCQGTAWDKRPQKGAREKTPRSGPRGGDPRPPAGVAAGGKTGLPESAATSHPAITKENHMPGAISDGYACVPAGKAIPGPGSGHGCWGPLALALCFADPVCVFLFSRESALYACGQAQPLSVSHISVLYLWFWSPGSQAGRESPGPLLRAHPAWMNPKSHGETHTP